MNDIIDYFFPRKQLVEILAKQNDFPIGVSMAYPIHKYSSMIRLLQRRDNSQESGFTAPRVTQDTYKLAIINVN